MKILVKMMLMSIVAVTVATMGACTADDGDLPGADGVRQAKRPTGTDSAGTQGRTVLVYLAGHNNLSDDLEQNVRQLKQGSHAIGDGTLLVFVRSMQSGRTPWLGRIEKGEVKDSVSVKDLGISIEGNYACDPQMMGRVMEYAWRQYPAEEYGLVLGGHSTGWLMEEEPGKAATRAFGHDTGDWRVGKAKWMNVTTMAQLLEGGPHLKFIFADCCNFMCLESLYQLRKTADYIVGSPSEIPGEGAPYDKLVTAFFEKTTFGTSIIDKYHAAQEGYLPLSIVKTSELEQLANATRKALDEVRDKTGEGYADTQGLIHYNYAARTPTHVQQYNLFYDAGDFLRSQLTESAYQQWKMSLDRAVIEKRFAPMWRTELSWSISFSDFEMTESRYHGVSMFVAQDPSGELGAYYARYNRDISQLEWAQRVGL